MRLGVRFGARSLVGAHDGLDADACAQRYGAALEQELRRRWPEAAIEISWTGDKTGTGAEVTGLEEAEARGVERMVLDVAWVVRQMIDWSADAE